MALPAPQDLTPVPQGPLPSPDDLTPVRSPLAEIGTAAKRGLYEGVQGTGELLQAPGEIAGSTPGVMARVGQAMARFGKQGVDANPAQAETHGGVTNFLSQAAAAPGQSLPVLAGAVGGSVAGTAAAGPVGGVVGGAVGGGSAAALQAWHEKYQEGLAKKLSDADARVYANQSAALQGAGMAAMSALPFAGPVAGKLIGSTAKSAAEAGAEVVGKRFLPEFGKQAAEIGVANTGIGVGTAAGQAAIDQNAGLETPTPVQAATSAILPSIAGAVGFLPLGALHAKSTAKQAETTQKALTDPATDAQTRLRALQTVRTAMDGVDPAGAQQWARNAASAIRNGLPVGLDDSWAQGPHPDAVPPAVPALSPPGTIAAGQGEPPAPNAAADENAAQVYAARDAEEARRTAAMQPQPAGEAPRALPAPGTPLGVNPIDSEAGINPLTAQHVANNAADHAASVYAARDAEEQRQAALQPAPSEITAAPTPIADALHAPDAGPLSRAAATAVDTGLAPNPDRPAVEPGTAPPSASDNNAAAAATPQQYPFAESMRPEIGWAEHGGRMIRQDMLDQSSPVIGRTQWIPKSEFWTDRPDKSLSETAAHAALDKATSGAPLRPIEQRFVDYAETTAKGREETQQREDGEAQAEADAEREAIQHESDYHTLSPDEQFATDWLLDDSRGNGHAEVESWLQGNEAAGETPAGESGAREEGGAAGGEGEARHPREAQPEGGTAEAREPVTGEEPANRAESGGSGGDAALGPDVGQAQAEGAASAVAKAAPDATPVASSETPSAVRKPSEAKPDLALTGQSNAEILSAEARTARAQQDAAAQEKAPSPEGFALTGSNRAADEAAARGQGDLLAAPEAKPRKRGKREPSAEYEAARQTANDATREYSAAALAYRAQKIGDDEYLAARAKHDAAQKAFDVAYAKEQQGARATVVETAKAIEPAEPAAPIEDIPKGETSAPIADFGEKIGGARKDTAVPLGKRPIMVKNADDRPAWARKYVAMQRIDRATSKPSGTWSLHIADKDGRATRVSRTEFATEAEALASIPLAEVARNHRTYSYKAADGSTEHGIYRTLGERKRALVKGGFATDDAAMKYMAQHPAEIIEHKFAFPEKPWLDHIERVGPAKREGNVSTKQFQDEFGFRAGEFGNWNMGSDGQAALNHAYDALHDLAQTLGVSPKALSLNGELAIAFGARGHGGKDSSRAHYESGRVVINLTKIRGAGSLAHEWFHALDDYLTRSTDTEGAARARKVLKDGARPYATHGFPYRTAARPELVKAFKALVDTMTAKREGVAVDENAANRGLTRAQESLKSTLDGLRSEIAKTTQYGAKKGAASAKQLAAWDALAQRALAGDRGADVYVPPPKGAMRGAMGYGSSEVVRALNAIYKDVRGRSFDRSDSDSLGRRIHWSIESVKDMNDRVAKAQAGTIEERKHGTEYLDEAKKIDSFRASNYWSTPHEMGARAFESYIFDKLAGEGKQSDYLTHGVENKYYALLGAKPYPEGAERTAIDAAFDNLFKVIQSKETDKGTALYSKDEPPPRFVAKYAYGRWRVRDESGKLGFVGNDYDTQAKAVEIAQILSDRLRKLYDRGPTGATSALDAQLHAFVNIGAKASDLLATIAKDSPTPFNRELAQRLKALGVEPKIDGGLAPDAALHGEGGKVAGSYDRATNTVSLFTAKNAERHLLHEFVHAATAAAIDRGTLAGRQMKALFDQVKAGGQVPKGVYGMTSVHEFVAEAHANAKFQAMLEGIPSTQGKSVWQRFVETVRKILGLPTERLSALDDALQVGEQLMRENAAARDVTERAPLFAKEDGTQARPIEELPKVTEGKAAEAEAQFTKSGKVLRAKGEGPQPITDKNRPAWVATAPPAAQAFLRKAGVWAEQKSWKDRWQETKHELGLKVIQGTVDQYRPVLDKIGKYSYQLLRMASAADNGVAAIVQHGHVELNTYGALKIKEGTKSLRQIMAPLLGEHDRFLAWMAANRAEMLMNQGREHNFSAEEIAAGKLLNSQMHPADKWTGDGTRAMAYARASKEFSALNKSVLDVGEAAGIIDPEARSVFEHEFYVNFRREESGEPAFNAANVSGMVNAKGIKRLKGGENQLHDLMANTINNWSQILSSALKNNAAWHTLEEAEGLGLAHRVKADETGSVYVLQDGKQVHWVVDDPLVAQAIGSLGQVPMRGPIMKGLGMMKHALTVGTTWSPIFRIRHTVREQITALAANPTGYNPVKNWLDGFKYSSKNNPEYASMAAGGAFFHLGMDLEGNRAAYVKRLIDNEIDPKSLVDSPHKSLAMLGHLADWWKETGERSDNITRANLYRQTYARMIAEGHDAERAHFEAAYVARDSMDYSLHGSFAAIRLITQVVPFANARLQGLYKLGRGAAENPKRFAGVVGGITLATMALSLAQRDDEDIQKASEWDRDNNWLIKIGNVMYRVPKPFEVGAMATVADRALETALNGFKPSDRERFISRLWPIIGAQLNLNPIPQAVFPALELWANYDTFRGTKIEPGRDEKLSTAEHISPSTSLTAQLLGKAGILSPQQIDFAVGAYLGWVGTHVVNTADLALRATGEFPSKPAPRLDDFFLIGDFAHQVPANQSRFVEQYYKHMQGIQEAFGDLRMMQAAGQTERAAEIMKSKGQEIQLHGLYLQTQREIGKLNQRARYVQMRDMPADEKRAELDRLAQVKDRLAETAEKTRAAAVDR